MMAVNWQASARGAERWFSDLGFSIIKLLHARQGYVLPLGLDDTFIADDVITIFLAENLYIK